MSSTAIEDSGDAWSRVFIALTAAIVIASAWFLAPIPFLSEDWTQLTAMRAIPSAWRALDPSLEPLRPLQHLYFWLLAHSGLDPAGSMLPFYARVVAFALHAGACHLVYLLARNLGARERDACLAMLVFAVFPNVKSIAWPAAIGSPGRVFFELCALNSFLQYVRTRKRSTAMLGIASFVIALGFHESAMLLSVLVAAWIVLGLGGTLRAGLRRLASLARDPWISVAIAIGIAHGVYLAFLRPQRHHAVKSFAALPANVVKAALALTPEWFRASGVEGFRGHLGTIGFVLGALALLLVAVVAVWAFARSPIGRFIVVAIGLELALPVLGTGFVQRYAYFASALLAIGLARWTADAKRLSARVTLMVVACLWTLDSGVDVAEYVSAGRAARELVEGARRARESASADAPIAIVDPPDMHGAEEDIPLFNWGLDFMLEANHVPGPWLFWRTGPSHTTTNVELVAPERITAGDAPAKLVYRR